nr:MAG TPA: hypothetical protein [Caudoviricetes sp.]
MKDYILQYLLRAPYNHLDYINEDKEMCRLL